MKNTSNTCGRNEALITAAYDMHDRMWGLSVSAVGRTSSALPVKRTDNSYVTSKKISTEYCLACVALGSGRLNNNLFVDEVVEAGDIILMLPGEKYTLTPDSDGWDIYWVEFGGNAVDNMVRNGFFTDKKSVFQVSEPHQIIETLSEIIKVMESGRAGGHQYAASLVHMLLGKLYYSVQSDNLEESYMLRIISQAKNIMKNETQMHLPIDMIAKELGVSYSLFRREFRRICGVPPGQYRQEVKLEKAKEMLHTTNTSIADIANHLSFENLGQFSTFFRKRMGVPPLEFRKKGVYSKIVDINKDKL